MSTRLVIDSETCDGEEKGEKNVISDGTRLMAIGKIGSKQKAEELK